MKAKVFLYLAAGLVVFLLGSLVMNQMVTAQINEKMPWPPTNVVFDEDPYKQHGLQTASFCEWVGGSHKLFETVPSGKKFIITDVTANEDSSSCNWWGKFAICGSAPTYNIKSVFLFGMPSLPNYGPTINTSVSFESGLVFDPNEEINITAMGSSGYVTISGYYVDL